MPLGARPREEPPPNLHNQQPFILETPTTLPSHRSKKRQAPFHTARTIPIPHTPTSHPPQLYTLHPPQTPTPHQSHPPTAHPSHTPTSHSPHAHNTIVCACGACCRDATCPHHDASRAASKNTAVHRLKPTHLHICTTVTRRYPVPSVRTSVTYHAQADRFSTCGYVEHMVIQRNG